MQVIIKCVKCHRLLVAAVKKKSGCDELVEKP